MRKTPPDLACRPPRCLGSQSVDWRWGDLWQAPLADAEVVYAFLSPAPMAALWEKVRAEMRPGTCSSATAFSTRPHTDQVIDPRIDPSPLLLPDSGPMPHEIPT